MFFRPIIINMPMKFDLHVHTNRSLDGVSGPEKMVKAALKKGLDGIAVTDHNTVAGWKEAAAAGKKPGLRVIQGEEIKVWKDGKVIGEILGLFLTAGIKSREGFAILEEIREQGGISVIAHPYDRIRSSPGMEAFFGKGDAIEALNSRVLFGSDNEKAMEAAGKLGKPVTAGSDAHTTMELGKACTLSDTEDLRKAIKQGKTRIYGSRSSPLVHVPSALGKLRILGR